MLSIRAIPFSGPSTLTAVARASAWMAEGAIIVTLERLSAAWVEAGVTIWVDFRALVAAKSR